MLKSNSVELRYKEHRQVINNKEITGLSDNSFQAQIVVVITIYSEKKGGGNNGVGVGIIGRYSCKTHLIIFSC